MKKLAQEVSLKGKCERITISELRSSPGSVLAMVELGKVFIITRQGREVAVLSKVPGEHLAMALDREGNVSHQLES